MYSEISYLLLITEVRNQTSLTLASQMTRGSQTDPIPAFPRLCALRTWSRNSVIEGGFPHSEIHGSKLLRSSPWLIAAYYVLHRLCAPRHPPNALRSLDCSHHQCPSEDGKDAELLVYINVRRCRRTPTLRPDFHRDRPDSRRFKDC